MEMELKEDKKTTKSESRNQREKAKEEIIKETSKRYFERAADSDDSGSARQDMEPSESDSNSDENERESDDGSE